VASVSRFLTNKLRLKGNEAKSAVARPEERKFLGFSISNDRAAHRAKRSRQIQGADPRHGAPDTGVQSATVDQRAEAIRRGMARLLRLLRDFASPHEPRSVDPSKIAFLSLAAAANRFKELCHRGISKFNAAVAAACPRASGECQDTRRSNRRWATAISIRSVFPESMRRPKLNSVEPPRYGFVRQVVWEGRRREASPIPILGSNAAIANG
jgi:hypothetical protein